MNRLITVKATQQPVCHIKQRTDEIMDNTKEIPKLKRQCQEIAGKIHDIVEETLWTDYRQIPLLSEQLILKIKEYETALKAGQR